MAINGSNAIVMPARTKTYLRGFNMAKKKSKPKIELPQNSITVAEAVALIGLSHARIKALCSAGRIKAKQVPCPTGGSHRWAIDRESAIEFTKLDRAPGNPHKKRKQ